MDTSRIIFVEGNIGSGKSTLIRELAANNSHITCIPEPISAWNEFRHPETDETILELYYKDPGQYAAFFQNVVVQSKIKILMEILKGPAKTYVLERSFYSDFWVFGRILRDKEQVTSLEYQFLRTWFDYTESMFRDLVVGVIYVDVPVETCHMRTIARARKGEAVISSEYLTTIQQAYTDWIDSTCAPVYRVDGCQTTEQIMASIPLSCGVSV